MLLRLWEVNSDPWQPTDEDSLRLVLLYPKGQFFLTNPDVTWLAKPQVAVCFNVVRSKTVTITSTQNEEIYLCAHYHGSCENYLSFCHIFTINTELPFPTICLSQCSGTWMWMYWRKIQPPPPHMYCTSADVTGALFCISSLYLGAPNSRQSDSDKHHVQHRAFNLNSRSSQFIQAYSNGALVKPANIHLW